MSDLTLTAGVECTCDDGMMAGIGTSTGTDGWNTLTCENEEMTPVSTVTAPMGPSPTDVEWCHPPLDQSDPKALVALWEDKNVSGVLDYWTREESENGGDNWVFNLVSYVDPSIGSTAIGGCGVTGGTCDLKLDCDQMAANGFGAHYWILTAVVGFHNKLDDNVIGDILKIDRIAADFSAPANTANNQLTVLANLLSAGLFMAGSLAGVVGVAAAEIGVAASATRAAALAAQRNLIRQGVRTGQTPDAAELSRLAGRIKASDTLIQQGGDTTRVTNALGASLWTAASSFSMVSAFAEENGQVDDVVLSDQLSLMFEQCLQQMKDLGARAMGRGGNYDALPTDPDMGDLPEDSYIAGFFADGKFLLAESADAFQGNLDSTYSVFRSKLVDLALQSGGLQVLAIQNKYVSDEDDCLNENPLVGPDPLWMDPLADGNFYCMQLFRANHGGLCAQLGNEGVTGNCDWVPAAQDVRDKLRDDYGFNLENYYSAAVQCNKAHLEDRMPDYEAMQSDGVTPACYYNIPAQLAEPTVHCNGDGSPDKCLHGYKMTDF
ncbi:uncharacterized protein LTR77_003299 [Saxophila tyrrhenica]|uniref:Uncharacterized protein n=1 Tax=Saxophila tyrrhenica TaxID=1690608 RepID=A0AAV9PK53_9PEZI|nr:hypothetical protein LTR77_003299 [Saxophila tyrrhenica]